MRVTGWVLVGKVGVEPTLFLMSRIYSPLSSPLDTLTHVARLSGLSLTHKPSLADEGWQLSDLNRHIPALDTGFSSVELSCHLIGCHLDCQFPRMDELSTCL